MPENPQALKHPRATRVRLNVCPKGYVTEAYLARQLGKHRLTILRWRMRGHCPPYVRIGCSVFYRESSIEGWLTSLEVDPAQAARASSNGGSD